MARVNIPYPYTDPDSYDVLRFKVRDKVYTWPSAEAFGVARIDVGDIKAKVDKKGKTGAAKPKVTTTGGERLTVKGELEITGAGWESALDILDLLRLGSLVDLQYPWLQFYGYKSFQVERIQPHGLEKGTVKVQLEFGEVNADAQNGAGKSAVKTPSQRSDLEKAQDEWLARARAARAATLNEQFNQQQAMIDEGRRTGNPVALHAARKVQVISSKPLNDINVISAAQRQPDKAGK